MYRLTELQDIIETELRKLDLQREPYDLYEPVKYILSNGGKRIRPSLVLMACNLFSDNILESINPALGIEVFHNFTLLHDDIMDRADIRRNKPTVHVKWDVNTAILSGDAMAILAYELISNSPAEKLPGVLKVFNRTAIEVCEGQQYDMNYENHSMVSEEEYLYMIKLKTAVLIAGSLKIGAILGGASSKEADLLYDLGINLGLAFQLQDDLLDAFGDESKFGKKTGGDIVENKKTFLLIKAFEIADLNTLQFLNQYFPGNNIEPEEKVSKILDIYTKLNIKSITVQKIDSCFNNAFYCLDQIKVKEEKKKEIRMFAESLSNRSY